MIAMVLAMQAVAPTAPYADCLSTRINADARMEKPPAEAAARVAIFDDAATACAAVRAKVPKAHAAMLDKIDASMKAVLVNPDAAEAEFGTEPVAGETP
ncbi:MULTISPECIES: hypothetical protein [unclassified Sphingomonas]|uniref:hypothetical protein n=1 Tax=unclassified Sphingomonas TaxID=196159 RepID=UPI0006F3A222|nr:MULTISPECIES: hypothetical protein [unclassified Sphingomonas]KQM61511.1 hypothetical protein ASE65_08275 [Sphingomonas sp. Leaf16]KQN12606.1 hypothetical protein ASE81_09285 [Sphingomonas sp. Leaf29]KQN19086.1 hypothetical protein ASE83_09210 [Sphingomonas sp. Leaf32]